MIHAAIFSLKDEGQEKLSENFKVKEFACKDGSNVVIIDPLLVWILQNVRDHFNKPVRIVSGYRTPEYNKGQAEDSRHMYGMAADFQVPGVTVDTIAQYLETVMPNTGGIGIYSNFVHVDTRTDRARWKE